MTEKLQAAENRYEELTQKLTDPDVLGNPELYKRIATSMRSLKNWSVCTVLIKKPFGTETKPAICLK